MDGVEANDQTADTAAELMSGGRHQAPRQTLKIAFVIT